MNTKNLFSVKGKAYFNGETYTFKPKNILQTTISVLKKDKHHGAIGWNWNGNLFFKILNSSGEKHYVFTKKGLLKFDFELIYEKQKVFVLSGVFNPTKLSYDFSVTVLKKMTEAEVVELLLYCGYAAKLYVTTAAST